MNKRKRSLCLDPSDVPICGSILTVLTVKSCRQPCFFSVLYLKIATALKWPKSWTLAFWWITSSLDVCLSHNRGSTELSFVLLKKWVHLKSMKTIPLPFPLGLGISKAPCSTIKALGSIRNRYNITKNKVSLNY